MSTSQQGARYEFRKRSEDTAYRIEYWHEYFILGDVTMVVDASRADFIVAHDEEVVYTSIYEPEEIAAASPQIAHYDTRYLSATHMQYMTKHGYSQFVVARMQGVI